MPELPEVEIVRRGLEPVLAGARLTAVEARRPDLRMPLPKRFIARLEGVRIESLSRRGKYLVAPLSTGETLVMHLGMTGRFTVASDRRPSAAVQSAGASGSQHDHIVFQLAGPSETATVTYSDPRRFGFMDLAPSTNLEQSRYFKGMGPEPLGPGFTAEAFAAVLALRRGPIKSTLLDQRVVAGLGNIYASEALFRARISPRRRAFGLGAGRIERLAVAIRAVLDEAIAAGGSTLSDFAAPEGASGYFQSEFAVYGRHGAPCVDCATPVRRMVQAGRATFYCPRCQR